MICMSSELSNNSTILNLEFNYDMGESQEPNSEVMKVKDFLCQVFGNESFNMEITPNGCRLISNFLYVKLNTMSKTKDVFKSVLTRFRNLDIETSFTDKPIPRVGYDRIKGFLYMPVDEITEKFRMTLFGQKVTYLDEEFWKDYIIHHIVPFEGERLNMTKVLQKLEQVNRLLGGDNLDEEEAAEIEQEEKAKEKENELRQRNRLW